MSISYRPAKLLQQIAPATKIRRLVTGKLTLNKAVLAVISDADFISKTTILDTALKVIRFYKAKFKDQKAEGLSIKDASAEAINEKKLMVSRVENSILYQVSQEIGDTYRGEFYIWTPSTAAEPDEEHMLNYAKKFQIGDGEMPGERYGCQCGMDILVNEDKLSL